MFLFKARLTFIARVFTYIFGEEPSSTTGLLTHFRYGIDRYSPANREFLIHCSGLCRMHNVDVQLQPDEKGQD